MAIGAGAAGAWTATNATTHTVTLPAHATGDLLIVIVACKASTITSVDPTVTTGTGWARVSSVADGTTNAGIGTGSVHQAIFWKVATSGAETNPVITWGGSQTAAPGIGVGLGFTKAGGDTWVTPVVVTGATTNNTAISVTMPSNPGITAGDWGVITHTTRDDSALTVPTWTATSATLAAVVVYPATPIASGTSNDMAGTAAYRSVTSGTASAAPVVTGTQAAAETGMTAFVRIRAQVLTNAAAGNAAGTGSSGDIDATVAPSGGNAAGTGTAQVANKTVSPNGGNATGTGTASNVTSLVVTNAITATGTGSANLPSIALLVNAAQATGTGAGFNATAVTSKDATAELATGTGTAANVTTAIVTNAGWASGTGDAGPTGDHLIEPNAGQATGSGAAFDATAETGTASTDADAELATGTGTAQTPSIALLVNAGHASGTGAALDITASTTDEAPAGTATGTGTGRTPSVTIVTNAEQATGTGAAQDPSTSVAPRPAAATGSGAAFDGTTTATGNKDVDAGLATGTCTAYNASVTATGAGIVDIHQQKNRRMRLVHPDKARGYGFAYDATVIVVPNVRVAAETATGTGQAFDANTVWDDDDFAMGLLLSVA